VIHPQAKLCNAGLALLRVLNRRRASLIGKIGVRVGRLDGRLGGSGTFGLDDHLAAVIASDSVLDSPAVLALARNAALANDLSHVV
jgi:hypothetical protein